MCTAITGSKYLSLKLFQIDPSVHWAQVNQQVSLGVSELHVILLHAMKLRNRSTSKEEMIATMEDNSGENRLVQTKDVDEAMQLNTENDFLKAFVNTAARLESIILVSNRVCGNYTLSAAVALRSKIKKEESQELLEIYHNCYQHSH